MDKPFWEKTYSDDAVTTFGVKPNRAIEGTWERPREKSNMKRGKINE